MAISFECACGKKMSAKDEFAGRRLRCPECHRVLTIPQPGATLLPIHPKATAAPGEQPGMPPSRLMIQPPKSDLAAMDVTRPVGDTLPPSQTPTFDSPENLEALFGPSLSRTPMLLPQSPLHVPPPSPAAETQPEEEPAVTPVVAYRPEPAPAENVWLDPSLEQVATPWHPGDERFQVGIPPAREAASPLEWLVPIIIVAVGIVVALT